MVERHPLGFFLPANAQLLMLGSFPPPRTRWSMEFYYPNFQNDMWRIMGLIFYDDKDFFVEKPRKFSLEKAKSFCLARGIALGDTGQEVVRQKGNASDKHLEIVTPIDLDEVLEKIPRCQAIVVTGEKAASTLLSILPPRPAPAVGTSESFEWRGRRLRLYRMPSSSRAYPKPLIEKAAVYRKMFEELGMVPVSS